MESKYKIFIYGIGDSNNASYIYLPINPEKIKITFASGIETINILGLGERLLVKDRKLQSISWSAFLPPSDGIVQAVADDSSYVSDPDSTVKSFKNAINNQTTCYLLINKINISGVESVYIERLPVIIEEFDTEEEGGLVNYIPYTITLRENPSGATSNTQVVSTTNVVSSTTTNSTTTTETTTKDISLIKERLQEGKSKWAIGDTVYVTANSALSDIQKNSSSYKNLYIYRKDSTAYKAYLDVSLYNCKAVIKDVVSTKNIINSNSFTTYNTTSITAPIKLYQVEFNTTVKRYLTNSTSVNKTFSGVNSAKDDSGVKLYTPIYKAWCPEECLSISGNRGFSGGAGQSSGSGGRGRGKGSS